MKFLGILAILILVLTVGKIPARGIHLQTLNQICNLVSEKFYRDDEGLEQWAKDCREKADQIGLWTTRSDFMSLIHRLLAQIEVSHLMIYDPQEDRRLWKGQDLDTGLRLYHIGDRFFLRDVIAGSAAEKLGLKKGDELIAIDHKAPLSTWQAESSSGIFEFQRSRQTIIVEMAPTELKIDRGPTYQNGILEISSFRSEYFRESNWMALASEVVKAPKLIVDVRGNSGGNIVAMLRALSIFFCDESEVGALSQPRRAMERGQPPPDDLDEMNQIAWLQNYKEVPLKTFSKYGCMKGPVIVLVDGQTSSVSEIFAEALLRRPKATVWGQSTAGDVVLATWYGLPLLGPGYSISIPESTYLTAKGELLEGTGVFPQKELEYEIEDAKIGVDTWIKKATYFLQALAN